MKPMLRTFQKTAVITTEAQYLQHRGSEQLVLHRWRLQADGEPVGPWTDADDSTNGGWAKTIKARELLEPSTTGTS